MENTTTPLNTFTELRAALGKPAPLLAPILGTPAPAAPAPVAVVTPPVVAEPAAETPVTPPVVADPANPDAVVTPPAEKKVPKRFSELTRERDAQSARAAAAEAELARLRATVPSQPATPRPAPVNADAPIPDIAGRPEKPDSGTWKGTWQELESAKDEYVEKLADWKYENNKQKDVVKASRQAAQAEWQKVDQTWQQQYDAAMEADDSFETQVAAVAKVVAPKGIVEVIKESPVATEIVKALHADPAKLEAIGKMSPASAAREIGRIEAGLVKAADKPVKAAPVLPSPPVVIGGSGDNSPKTKPLGDLPMSEFRERAKSLLKPGHVGLTVRKMTIG